MLYITSESSSLRLSFQFHLPYTKNPSTLRPTRVELRLHLRWFKNKVIIRWTGIKKSPRTLFVPDVRATFKTSLKGGKTMDNIVILTPNTSPNLSFLVSLKTYILVLLFHCFKQYMRVFSALSDVLHCIRSLMKNHLVEISNKMNAYICINILIHK